MARLVVARRVARRVARTDRRRSRLELTPAGRAVYGEIVPLALGYERRLLASLSPAEAGALDAALTRLQARAAALGRLDVANWSVVIATVLYFVAALVLVAMQQVTPAAFAWLLVASELYVLAHCAVRLLPLARRRHSARLAEARS